MKHPLLTAAAAALVALALIVWGLWPVPEHQASERPLVALVLDTDIGVRSAVIDRGARMAAREFSMDLNVVAAPGAKVPEWQIERMREQLDLGAKAVLLVPSSAGTVAEAVRLCDQRDAKLVLLDACEPCRGEAFYVGTDHASSGSMAVEAMRRLFDPKRLLILYRDDQVSGERLAGVRSAARRAGIQTVACPSRVDDSIPCRLYIQSLIQQNLDADAILCLDGTLSGCAAAALRKLDAQRKIALAGFDCDQTQIDSLQDETIRFTILRQSLGVGYLGFRRAVELMRGTAARRVEFVDTKLIMSADALDPENVGLMFPLLR